MRQGRARSQTRAWHKGMWAGMVATVVFARDSGYEKEVRAPTPVRCKVLLGTHFWPHGIVSHPPEARASSLLGMHPVAETRKWCESTESDCGDTKEPVLMKTASSV